MHLDRQGIAALVDALAGSGKALVGTTGIMLMTPGQISTERDASDPASPAGFRVQSVNAVLMAAERDVRACVGASHPRSTARATGKASRGSSGNLARQTGKSAYVDDAAIAGRQSPQRCRPAIPPCRRTGSGRRSLPRRSRSGSAPSPTSPERSATASVCHCLAVRRRGRSSFRVVAGVRRQRQSNFQRHHSQGLGVGPRRARPSRRHTCGLLFLSCVRCARGGASVVTDSDRGRWCTG